MAKFTEETWKKHHTAEIERMLKLGLGSSKGIVCLQSSIKYIRNGLLANLPAAIEKAKADKKPFDFANFIKEEMAELVKTSQGKNEDKSRISNMGFCCNASQAAKACGFGQDASEDEVINMD